MEPVDLLMSAAIGAVYGIVYAAYGIATKRGDDEPVKPKKAGRTLVLWAAAGIVVSVRQGGTITEGNIEQATAEVAVVGVAFDMLWSKLRRMGYLDWVPGVSASPA